MTLWIISSLLAMMIASMTMLAAFILNNRSSLDREKLSPFECGFDPKSTARIPFSMRFFLLAIIFIVFDIEIVLLMPLPLLMNINSFSVTMISMIFILILILGLFHEWIEGSLDWSS